jgi:hypothetical protein
MGSPRKAAGDVTPRHIKKPEAQGEDQYGADTKSVLATVDIWGICGHQTIGKIWENKNKPRILSGSFVGNEMLSESVRILILLSNLAILSSTESRRRKEEASKLSRTSLFYACQAGSFGKWFKFCVCLE